MNKQRSDFCERTLLVSRKRYSGGSYAILAAPGRAAVRDRERRFTRRVALGRPFAFIVTFLPRIFL